MAKGKGGSGRMTVAAAARIQSATAKTNGGKVVADSFAARAQSGAAANAAQGKQK